MQNDFAKTQLKIMLVYALRPQFINLVRTNIGQ